MDIVLTYVNGLDPEWQKDYASATGKPVLEKRFRDWGTMKYLFRGFEKHMPFIGNVFLVVSRESQVPEWIDRSVVKVIYHKDIIPSEKLPVFNSAAIEVFLHRIPGLSEEYVYFNDDMFPVMDCSESDFFVNGTPALGFSRHLFAANLYKTHTKNSDSLARKALGMRPPFVFIRPQHTCSPMLKSQCEKLFAAVHDEILDSVSALREKKNVNQYVYLDYMYHSGKMINRRLQNKHLSLAASSADMVCRYIENPTYKLICVNDVQMPEDVYEATRDKMLASFEKHFPEKSRFEK